MRTVANIPLEGKQKPQPKWIVLQALNFVVLTVFIGSVIYVTINYRASLAQPKSSPSPLTNMFFPMMVVWTVCLAYFFGFFGISFLDKDELSDSPSSFGLEAVRQQADASHNITSSKTSATTDNVPTKHVPRHDTPICAEIPIQQFTKCAINIERSKPSLPEDTDFHELTNEEILECLKDGSIKDYQLEKKLKDCERAVVVRRMLYEDLLGKSLQTIPFTGYDWDKVFGANCEIVVGYIPIPVGIVGPLVMNGEPMYVPMATTEGCLVASTNRGCKAISMAGGCFAVVLKDAITRAPCVRMPTAMRAAAMKRWISEHENYTLLETAFNSTTNFGRLHSIDATVAGRNVYLRFCCMSGDAMGMNMVSKGCLKAMEVLEVQFPDMDLIAISGNMCIDKKPAAINWILGRGKSIVVEAVISESIVKTVLKTTVHEMIETNKQKNHIGSAMAGAIGGFNAHAANIVTAVYLATGQDPAQNVESSNCITIMEYAEDGKSLHVSVTMPSIEVGTVGGGTHLPAQAGCLDICGVRGAAKGPDSKPGDNSRKLAQIVGSSVLAGELSLIAALAANHLVHSHMQHNRKPAAAVEAAPAKGNVRKNASMPDFSHVVDVNASSHAPAHAPAPKTSATTEGLDF